MIITAGPEIHSSSSKHSKAHRAQEWLEEEGQVEGTARSVAQRP